MQPSVAIALIAAAATLCAAGVALFGVWIGHILSKRTSENQWRLDQKLKIYSEILRSINDYSVWVADTSEWRKFGSQAGRPYVNTINKENNQIATEFHAAYAVAALFVGDESMRLLELVKPVFYYHSDPLANFEVADLDSTFDTLERARAQLVYSASTDLKARV